MIQTAKMEAIIIVKFQNRHILGKIDEYVKREVPIWGLDFEANRKLSKQTGEGHPLRIMSTVVAIVNDFISRS